MQDIVAAVFCLYSLSAADRRSSRCCCCCCCFASFYSLQNDSSTGPLKLLTLQGLNNCHCFICWRLYVCCRPLRRVGNRRSWFLSRDVSYPDPDSDLNPASVSKARNFSFLFLFSRFIIVVIWTGFLCVVFFFFCVCVCVCVSNCQCWLYCINPVNGQ